MSDAGRVTGYASTVEGSNHAFFTGTNGVGMTDLNSLVGLPARVVLTVASGINNHGQVVVNAMFVPEPKTYAMLLAWTGHRGLYGAYSASC